MIGKVTFWNQSRGFGFIYSEDTNVRTFFHITNFVGAEPYFGQVVSYEEAVDERRQSQKAINVTPILTEAQ